MVVSGLEGGGGFLREGRREGGREEGRELESLPSGRQTLQGRREGGGTYLQFLEEAQALRVKLLPNMRLSFLELHDVLNHLRREGGREGGRKGRREGRTVTTGKEEGMGRGNRGREGGHMYLAGDRLSQSSLLLRGLSDE